MTDKSVRQLVRFFAVQQMKKMTGGAVVVGFGVEPVAVRVKVMPVEQHCAETGGQPVGDGDLVVAGAFGLQRAEHRAAGAHDIHRMRAAGNQLEHSFQRGGQAAHAA